MGLIKAATSAIGSTMHDQWKEAIRCENMTNEILMEKQTTPTGVITNKSTIIVAPGQCAIIYDNGKVIDATAEEGIYTFDTSSSPSFFAGQFGAVFKEMWQRFTYDGASAKQQAVFFFNIKEIVDNKFGTASPIPFQDWSHPIPNQMTNTITPLRVQIKCFGTYTFYIENPALFMSKIAGTAQIYKKQQLTEQLRGEVMAVFQNVVNELGDSKHKIPVLEMPSQTDEIRQMMDEQVFDEPMRQRGIKINCFAVESVTLDEESKQKIDDYELSSNSYMQQGKMVGSYSEAVKSAAENQAGSMNGFMGIGMMNMATGNVMNNATAASWQPSANSYMDLQQDSKKEEKVEQEQKEDSWNCTCGAQKQKGKFCMQCGKKKPEEKECPTCKNKVPEDAKFCSRCGTKLEE